MTEALGPQTKRPTGSEHLSTRGSTPTIASLGVRAHLITADVDRERQVAELIASLESHRVESERLFQRILEFLGRKASATPDIERPSPLSRRD